jgi:hypothetical protein
MPCPHVSALAVPDEGNSAFAESAAFETIPHVGGAIAPSRPSRHCDMQGSCWRMDQSANHLAGNRAGKSTRTSPSQTHQMTAQARHRRRTLRRWHQSQDQDRRAAHRLRVAVRNFVEPIGARLNVARFGRRGTSRSDARAGNNLSSSPLSFLLFARNWTRRTSRSRWPTRRQNSRSKSSKSRSTSRRRLSNARHVRGAVSPSKPFPCLHRTSFATSAILVLL